MILLFFCHKIFPFQSPYPVIAPPSGGAAIYINKFQILAAHHHQALTESAHLGYLSGVNISGNNSRQADRFFASVHQSTEQIFHKF
ncbi:TPA: hypothetical protein DIU27_05550 [Candidatus Collierbacteria bacterium]|nr:hypothetical protein [Candidatus Collierbacteria bacterium]